MLLRHWRIYMRDGRMTCDQRQHPSWMENCCSFHVGQLRQARETGLCKVFQQLRGKVKNVSISNLSKYYRGFQPQHY